MFTPKILFALSSLVALLSVFGVLILMRSLPGYPPLNHTASVPPSSASATTSSSNGVITAQKLSAESTSSSKIGMYVFLKSPPYYFKAYSNPSEIYFVGTWIPKNTTDWGWDEPLTSENATTVTCLKSQMTCMLGQAWIDRYTNELVAVGDLFTVDTWSGSVLQAQYVSTPFPDCSTDCGDGYEYLHVDLNKKTAQLTYTTYWDGTSTIQYILGGVPDFPVSN